MNINWEEAFNRLFEIINTKIGNDEAPYYLKGSEFLKIIQTVDYGLPRNYTAFMKQLKDSGKSQSRKDWYKDLLNSLKEDKRKEAYFNLIESIEQYGLDEVTALKKSLGLVNGIPKPVRPNPDPKMSQEAYSNVIQIINRTLKSFEQKKSLYSLMGEEQIRDYVIGYLEDRHEDITATRESLNKGGKTDILLKYTDQTNLFVAECKFWSGQQAFLSTINQLLGYLTWRDSKAAVIIFVDNVNFNSVLTTIKATAFTHPNFVKHVKDTDKSSFSYLFHFPGDTQKQFQLEVMAYHLPK